MKITKKKVWRETKQILAFFSVGCAVVIIRISPTENNVLNFGIAMLFWATLSIFFRPKGWVER